MVEEVYLVSAGASDEEAAAAARAIPDVKNLATKQDLAELKTELKQDIAGLKSDMKLFKFVDGPALSLQASARAP